MVRRSLWALVAVLAPAAGCADPTGPSGSISVPRSFAATLVFGEIARVREGIYLSDGTGSSIVSLVAGSTPSWSPDSRKIAFTRDGSIFVIESSGRNERRLATGTWPSWSPDGGQLSFTSAEGISVMNADGSAVKTLIHHDFRKAENLYDDMGVSKSAWSPNGVFIAFEHLGDGDMEPAQVYVMNADGSHPRRLSSSNTCGGVFPPGAMGCRSAESDPSWSPDGSKLVFWSYGFGITVADFRAGRPTTLYRNFPFVAYGARPGWSPDGKLIGFNSYPYSVASILVIPAAGGAAQTLIHDAHSMSWSPDGARIAFVRNRIAKTK